MSITIPTPPTASYLADLLSLLQPPQLPLPATILSTDLKTRHLYLPPSASTLDSYIQQRPTGSHLVDRLTSIAEEWEQAGYEEVPRASLHDRIEDTELSFTQRDEHTILCRFGISSPIDTTIVEVTLIHEGESIGWLLFDVGLPSDDSDDWFDSAISAHSTFLDSQIKRKLRNPRPEELEDDEGDDDEDDKDGWEGNGNSGDPRGTADDFWGGYSEDEKEVEFKKKSQSIGAAKAQQNVPVPTAVTVNNPIQYDINRQSTPTISRKPSASGSTIDDPYWSHYASVEDGLRVSNPPSRTGSLGDLAGFGRIRGGGGGGGLGRGEGSGYYGSGGETPVRWTPAPSVDVEGAEGRKDVAARSSQTPDQVVDLSTSTEFHPAASNGKKGHLQTANYNARQNALAKTLAGLYEMYGSGLDDGIIVLSGNGGLHGGDGHDRPIARWNRPRDPSVALEETDIDDLSTHLVMTNHALGQVQASSTRYQPPRADQSPSTLTVPIMASSDSIETPVSRRLSSVRHIIIVLSGKGGVGKSSSAVQLALSLLAISPSTRVGLLDLDLTGPSLPRMLGLDNPNSSRPPAAVHQSSSGWIPVYVDSERRLGCMSIGFLLKDRGDSVVWRGPKKDGMIRQFLAEVRWGDLDYLVIDTPPGTSDEHISLLTHLHPLFVPNPSPPRPQPSYSPTPQAILITTPQQTSLNDTLKSLSFARKLNLPVLGIVENMSGYVCPCCGEISDVFSSGGGEKMAMEQGVGYLGRVPIDTKLVQLLDDVVDGKLEGESSGAFPLVEKYEETGSCKVWKAITRDILERIRKRGEKGSQAEV